MNRLLVIAGALLLFLAATVSFAGNDEAASALEGRRLSRRKRQSRRRTATMKNTAGWITRFRSTENPWTVMRQSKNPAGASAPAMSTASIATSGNLLDGDPGHEFSVALNRAFRRVERDGRTWAAESRQPAISRSWNERAAGGHGGA